jgi:hypothetical protein
MAKLFKPEPMKSSPPKHTLKPGYIIVYSANGMPVSQPTLCFWYTTSLGAPLLGSKVVVHLTGDASSHGELVIYRSKGEKVCTYPVSKWWMAQPKLVLHSGNG